MTIHIKSVSDSRGDPVRLRKLFERSLVPMLLVDDERRYVDANRPAQSMFGLSLEELRRMRMEDLTPPYRWAMVEAGWTRLIESGVVMQHELSRPEGSFMGVSYYAIAEVLPGRHVIAFVPGGWTDGHAPEDLGQPGTEQSKPLTAREAEVLQLAAGGLNGPQIAAELVIARATVRTHFTHIYEKLGVSDRAGAVAKAMRLGLIR